MSVFKLDTGSNIPRMRVGLVGCGNIGADICIALQKGEIPAEIVALTDIDENRAKILLMPRH